MPGQEARAAGPGQLAGASGQAQQAWQQAQAQNRAVRHNILRNSINMFQLISTQQITGYTAGQGYNLNVPLRNVGLNKRIYLECIATVVQGAAETQTLCGLGPANLLSNITLTDIYNFQRHNTSGIHLHLLASAKRRAPFGAAYTTSDPTGFGANIGVVKAPSSFTTSSTVTIVYEVPICYDDTDLRGAIWANTPQATWNVNVTVNPNFYVSSTGDPTRACYQSSTGQLGRITNLTINVYQEYLDQLPGGASPALPAIDIASTYQLIESSYVNGLAAGTDYPVPYTNKRQFFSTICMFENNLLLNAGTDINYFALQTANQTYMYKADAIMTSLLTREMIGDDFPKGCYYFDHRKKPILTDQLGNTQFIINPSAVNGNTQIWMQYEMMGLTGIVAGAAAVAA